ncbi:hypothetical protein [Streptomyces tsukubensis]|uniref:hypothetical protein n=1 Tax=Streptomyces tsukubensis TaxID=83656 RepID=UPI00344D13BD
MSPAGEQERHGLGESERICLDIIFRIDQGREAESRKRYWSDEEKYVPARIWRHIPLGEVVPQARSHGIDLEEIDGFILVGLAERGLITHETVGGVVILSMTTDGRSVARGSETRTTRRSKTSAAEQRRRTWDALGDAARTTLEAVFEVDQEKDAANKRRYHQSRKALPARDARRITLGDIEPRIQSHVGGLEDQASQTLPALAHHGLIETETIDGEPSIWITRQGRAVVKQSTGRTATPGPARSRPSDPSVLSKGLWTMMATVARSGTDGVDYLYHGAVGHLLEGKSDERPFLRRAEVTLQTADTDSEQETLFGLGAEEPSASTEPAELKTVKRYRFTAVGRAFYTEHLDQYRELYPTIEAPDLLPDS